MIFCYKRGIAEYVKFILWGIPGKPTKELLPGECAANERKCTRADERGGSSRLEFEWENGKNMIVHVIVLLI